jgi:hypothetical protein
VLHPQPKHVEKSQLHGAIAVFALDRRLSLQRQGVAGHQPAVSIDDEGG